MTLASVAMMVNDDDPYQECGERADNCVCKAQAGHERDDEPHLCCCGAQWRGSFGEDDFEPVTWPKPPGLRLLP